MLPAVNGIHTWVPAAAVKDLKVSAVTRDENLSWEEFHEAMPHIINMMKVQDWLDNRHLTVGSMQVWSLEEINQDLLIKAREELFNNQLEKKQAAAIQPIMCLQNTNPHVSSCKTPSSSVIMT
ncbi:uncharacterized protein BJ212DRAFT_1305217 [Suillus subaureus]|uniref:Uncharacterized protein n=1 Tax=Suillus subaureus TaxID=48587 RepID=A0A9P7DQN9_9AGAM|nr:uncharacterized protein BJ212DRAFT_1305217 [Suillus subaureus]KAG1800680.1 hypothetical protein BJ212DRAFT_1305217 [Suillus subaureus]